MTLNVRTPFRHSSSVGRGWVGVVVCLASLGGCTGSIGGEVPAEAGEPAGFPGTPTPRPPRGTAPSGPRPDGQAKGPAPEPASCPAPAPGPLPMRRLTKRQFSNSVRDLLGVTPGTAAAFPETSLRGGYRTWAGFNTVTADGAEDIAEAAAAVAGKATANLPALLGCTPGMAGDDACVRGFIANLARRAYRRPVEAAELETLTKVYADLRAQALPPAEAVAGVTEVLLQSPQFLYLTEVGRTPGAPAGSVVPLTDHEVAARLSYALHDTLPDDELARLADEGKLRTREQIELQARRLVGDRRVEPLLAQFVEDWLELYRLDGQTKDAKSFPEWNAGFVSAARDEATAFATEVAFRGDHAFATLLSAPWTMASAATAPIYGAARPASAGHSRVELDRSQRAGLLTSTAFLSAHAGSNEPLLVLRGVTIRRHLLCMEVELPPGLDVTSPVPNPKESARVRFKQHSADPSCAGCHAYFDPIGFGLEGYDAIGRVRSTEGNGIKVDTTGRLDDAGDATGPFQGGAELGAKLGASQTARACFARQLFSFVNARPSDDSADRCSLGFIERKFAEADGDIRELIVAIAVSDSFTHRRMPERGQ